MLQLLSPRTLRLGGESQVTPKLSIPAPAASAPLEGAVRNVHRRDAEDAEMLQLLSPRTLRLGGESQVTPKLSIPGCRECSNEQ